MEAQHPVHVLVIPPLKPIQTMKLYTASMNCDVLCIYDLQEGKTKKLLSSHSSQDYATNQMFHIS